jgi:hypothetical protein
MWRWTSLCRRMMMVMIIIIMVIIIITMIMMMPIVTVGGFERRLRPGGRWHRMIWALISGTGLRCPSRGKCSLRRRGRLASIESSPPTPEP